MDRAKYIVVEHNSGRQDAIIFPCTIEHFQATRIAPSGKIISAGMIQFGVEDGKVKVYCYGKSVSLKIESHPEEDAKLIKKYIIM